MVATIHVNGHFTRLLATSVSRSFPTANCQLLLTTRDLLIARARPPMAGRGRHRIRPADRDTLGPAALVVAERRGGGAEFINIAGLAGLGKVKSFAAARARLPSSRINFCRFFGRSRIFTTVALTKGP